MHLQDLLDATQLRLRPRNSVPGAASRTIDGTFTTDLLDPRRYIAPNQVVLTGLVWRRSAEDSETFVRAVAASGAAALLAGAGLLGFVPEDLVQACTRLGVPLYEVPADVSFGTVTSLVATAEAGDRVARLTAGLVRQRDLLTEVYRGRLLDDLVARTAAELRLPLHVLTATGRVVAGTSAPLAPVEVERVVARGLTAAAVPATVPGARGDELSVFPITGAGPEATEVERTTAWFVVAGGDWDSWSPALLDAVTELVGVVGLYRVQREGEALERSALADRLVELVEQDSEQPETAVQLRQCGLLTGQRLVVVVAAFEGRADLLPLAVHLLSDAAAHVGRPVVGRDRDQRAVAFVPADAVEGLPAGADPLAVVLSALRRAAPGLGERVLRVGASTPVALGELGGALRSARYGMLLPPAPGEGSAVRINDSRDVTSSVQLLAAVPDHLRSVFVELVLGRLVEHDARYSSQLVGTLKAFLDCGGSWVRTAEQTHLHLNTVRYRIARVEELTGRDLSDTSDRADLYLALALR